MSRPLNDTDDGDSPFWSPDNRFVAFFSQGLLKRKEVATAAPAETVARATVDMRGGAWNEAGTIAQAADYVDFRLSPDGTALALSRTSQQTQAPDIWVLDRLCVR